jgi:deoxyribonuclease I
MLLKTLQHKLPGRAITLLGMIALSFTLALSANGAPTSFEAAKIVAKNHVYFDRNTVGTFYCACEWEWTGRSGGRIDHASCGYSIRAQSNRANRIEWEHIVPASNFGRARQCWQHGGRQNCKATDLVFNVMEADLHNLTPSVGEINADRSNYNFGLLPSSAQQHGACAFKVDFQQRTAEPREAIRGKIARIYMYMHDRYDLPISRQQEQLLMAWDKAHPVTAWERERDRRIAALGAGNNPFVTGEQQWTAGRRNSGAGIVTQASTSTPEEPYNGPVRGNRNSKVYHRPIGCPSYGQVAEHNRVAFSRETEAIQAGYRVAGNCSQ